MNVQVRFTRIEKLMYTYVLLVTESAHMFYWDGVVNVHICFTGK